MKIYISIPITGHDVIKVREHTDHIKMTLSRKGHEVVSPFDIYSGKNPEYDDYICNDLRAMLDCDAVFFCDGWRNSCGCNIEHDVACRYKAFGKKNFRLFYENGLSDLHKAIECALATLRESVRNYGNIHDNPNLIKK